MCKYAVVSVLMQSLFLSKLYDNLGGRSVTAEVVFWGVEKVIITKFMEHSTNTSRFVIERTNNSKHGLQSYVNDASPMSA